MDNFTAALQTKLKIKKARQITLAEQAIEKVNLERYYGVEIIFNYKTWKWEVWADADEGPEDIYNTFAELATDMDPEVEA